MKKEDIKRYLKPYLIRARCTTINNAFASAIAPYDDYKDPKIKDKKLIEALRFLGQNPNEDLTCVFCKDKAETWDHLIGLVKNGELQGLGHQIGNLVPCCKQCNSAKGNKEFQDFINKGKKINGDKKELKNLLSRYQKKFAKEIKLEILGKRPPSKYKEFKKIKQEIFDLIKKADELADKLRANILE